MLAVRAADGAWWHVDGPVTTTVTAAQAYELMAVASVLVMERL